MKYERKYMVVYEGGLKDGLTEWIPIRDGLVVLKMPDSVLRAPHTRLSSAEVISPSTEMRIIEEVYEMTGGTTTYVRGQNTHTPHHVLKLVSSNFDEVLEEVLDEEYAA